MFSAFSGYDSQCLAMRRLEESHPGFKYELVGWSEIDEGCVQAHDALFPEWRGRNYGDISRIDWTKVPNFEMMTYSSPCQDFSSAGDMRGGKEGSGTRSSLLWECKRAIEEKRPKVLILENVPNLISERFRATFNEWERVLAGMGYENYIAKLNARDYGIPQSRNRLFMVSLLDGGPYHFPDPEPLGRRFADMAEDEVAEHYFVNEEQVDNIFRLCKDYKEANRARILGYTRSKDGKRITYHTGDVANTLHGSTGRGGNTDQFVLESLKEYQFIQYPRGMNEGGVKDTEVCPSITISNFQNNVFVIGRGKRVRRLTERECFRLKGLRDWEIDTIQATGLSGSVQYRMAGNSIVVDVLERIISNVYYPVEEAGLLF